MKHVIDYTNAKTLTRAIEIHGFKAKVMQSEFLGLLKAAFHHAAEFGNYIPLTKAAASMPKSARANAVKAWAERYAPIVWTKDKGFKKSKSSTKEWDLVGAMKADPFAAPSIEGKEYDSKRDMTIIINALARMAEHGEKVDVAELMTKADEVAKKRMEKAMKDAQKAA